MKKYVDYKSQYVLPGLDPRSESPAYFMLNVRDDVALTDAYVGGAPWLSWSRCLQELCEKGHTC